MSVTLTRAFALVIVPNDENHNKHPKKRTQLEDLNLRSNVACSLEGKRETVRNLLTRISRSGLVGEDGGHDVCDGVLCHYDVRSDVGHESGCDRVTVANKKKQTVSDSKLELARIIGGGRGGGGGGSLTK